MSYKLLIPPFCIVGWDLMYEAGIATWRLKNW